MIYLISRHPGAIDWLRERIHREFVCTLSHLYDLDTLHAGDCIIGTLPLDKVADLSGRGVRYLHLCVSPPPNLRGRELSADTLDKLEVTLREFIVTPVDEELQPNSVGLWHPGGKHA